LPRSNYIIPVVINIAFCVAYFAGQLVHAYPPPADPLVRIHYDLEVAGYCSKITPAVSAGFHSQLKIMVENLNADRETILKARSDAMTAVYREWGNRGLGGFRGWCRKEGVASANRFSPNSKP